MNLEKELERVKRKLIDEEFKNEISEEKWKNRENELKKSLDVSCFCFFSLMAQVIWASSRKLLIMKYQMRNENSIYTIVVIMVKSVHSEGGGGLKY